MKEIFKQAAIIRILRIGAVLLLLLSASIIQAKSSQSSDSIKVVHVFVALCDNVHQGIVPVSADLGNGQSPRTNLYWGALYGVKTFFATSESWKSVMTQKNPRNFVLERCIFKSSDSTVIVVADAYDGRKIKRTVEDFLSAAAGSMRDSVKIAKTNVLCGSGADLLAYVGHNGLMDFTLSEYPKSSDSTCRETIILACASKWYFEPALDSAGACPLLWTTGLMAPEAYTLLAAIESWAKNQPKDSVWISAAEAYSRYQNCSLKASKALIVPGCP